MGNRRKNSLPFDSNGGTLTINRRMLNSPAYLALKCNQKVLLLLLHEQWRNDRPVAYSIREAAKKLHCADNTACKGFKRLQEHGFIRCHTESLFNSKNGSKAREWVLTWMPSDSKPPSNDWEK